MFDPRGRQARERRVHDAVGARVAVVVRIAEKVAVAQSLGSLSLSLRSIADNTAELERAVASGQVKLPQSANPADERKMLLAIASQPIDSNPTFTTGGDVSRFQRRTVPARSESNSNSGAGGAANPALPVGPVVRIARGNEISIVPMGAR